MTTGEAKKIAGRMLNMPSLARVRKFLILGLNRKNPGLGDDAVFIDRETGLMQFLSGEFRQGTRVSKNKDYLAACEEYREGDWVDEEDEDEWDPEDDPYRELDEDEMDDEEHIFSVIVPKDAKFLTPGTEIQISYGCDSSSQESAEEWKSDSYRIEGIETLYDLSFHINKSMDGIILDEDFFDFPLVCWNTGSLPIKVEGQKIPANTGRVLSPNHPKRKALRLKHEDIMSLPVWDSANKIARNEELLLALGCPNKDAHILAGYFWRNSFLYDVTDYNPADHAVWMDRVHREGRPQPQS